MTPAEMLLNAFVLGALLGGLYALISIGLSMTNGLLKIANFAHVGFLVLAGYIAYLLNIMANVDPIIASIIISPLFLDLDTYYMYYTINFLKVELFCLVLALFSSLRCLL